MHIKKEIQFLISTLDVTIIYALKQQKDERALRERASDVRMLHSTVNFLKLIPYMYVCVSACARAL